MNRRLPLALILLLLSLPVARAADEPQEVTAQDFPKLFAQWKEHLGRFAQLRTKYQTDPAADKKALEAEAKQLGEQTKKLLPTLIAAGKKAYLAAPNQDKQLSEFLVAAAADYLGADNYEQAADLSRVLIDNKCENQHLDLLAGIALFNSQDFEAAQKHLEAAKESGSISQDAQRYLELVDQYKQMWAEEQALRAAEDKAGDLPKVKLETSAGDVVVVLFENEAPNTVANFINLVEKGFYDGLAFHRVIPGFMAQGGDPNGDGSGGPGYTIPDEVNKPNYRKHFRGSLSMAKTTAPDSGGSQFFLCFVPTAHLDGKHTVFGRVVEGMDVLSKLARTEGVAGNTTPDKIKKATVIFKRPHDYKPRTLPDK